MKGYYDHRKPFNLMWGFGRNWHLGIMYKEWGVQLWCGDKGKFLLYLPGRRIGLIVSKKEWPKIEVLKLRREKLP